jgi:hypothetical protein
MSLDPATGLLSRVNHWTFTGGGLAAPLVFEVPGPIAWERPEEARTFQTPCGGPPIILDVENVLQPRKFKLGFLINPGTAKAARMAALEALWAGRGPYTLTGPYAALSGMTVRCDPSQGGLKYQSGPYVGSLIVMAGFEEQA